MNVFARRAGHARGLAAEHARFIEYRLWAVGHVFGDGAKGVSVALGKAIRVFRRQAGGLLFQYLRLFTFMVDVGQ